jgi:YVTN family beta-propeller protein
MSRRTYRLFTSPSPLIAGLALLAACQPVPPDGVALPEAEPAVAPAADEPARTAEAATAGSFTNFEGAQTNPVRVSADGTRLYVVDTPDARLSVFDLATPASPRLIAEIPVGIEPVSVNPRTTDEVWVVNQVSDSISIVSASRRIVTDTLYVEDEPADVVFAGSPERAFVSVARSNQVQVFDVSTHARVATINLTGSSPRALATSPDRTHVYVAFALSGNHSTIIPAAQAPAPPTPTNPALPPAPQQGIIVDASNPTWNPSVIKYTLPDNDVADISTSTLTVSRYFSRVGAVNLGLAVRPTTGDLYVANTDARNLVRFEPNVRGHFVDNRVTRITTAGQVTPVDLNPGLDYAALPNTTALSTALAQPAALVFEPGGSYFYVAAFGTDRVARVDPNGNVLARIEIGNATGATADPRNKRGPRGLALHPTAGVLYVANRISNTLSVVNTGTNAVSSEIAVGAYDPTPSVIRAGRGFLYDAKLSGNGTAACAACHVDAELDLLAWDLGDPNGSLQTVNNGLGGTETLHPMKGPMTTQTLRGLNGVAPYHWRGDRADFLTFNGAFSSLMGGAQLSTADMTAFRDFINTVAFPGGNPNRNLDNTLPATLGAGSPSAGLTTYQSQPFTSTLTCNSCHALTSAGTNRAIIPASALQEPQAMKVAHLRNLYTKNGFNKTSGAASVNGFGYTHDGAIATLFEFLSQPVFGNVSTDTTKKNNLVAFLACFDTGVLPIVGYSRTVTSANVSTSAVSSDLTLLQNQAVSNADLIAKGTIDGVVHGLVYQPASNNYRTDQSGLGPFTLAQLQAKVSAGDTLTFTSVPRGAGTRMGIDRDQNGVLDFDQGGP